MTFSSSQFRRALGSFATGVTVVTACDASGQRFGLTASSFNSVSLEPPLVLWSLALRSSAMPVFFSGAHYVIHVLGADQVALAERFSAKGVDRFAGLEVGTGMHGAPVLFGALAVFECVNRSQYQEGDHVIFVGEVQQCTYRETVGLQDQPLIYHGGNFFSGTGGAAQMPD
jgi:flavin reductase (DIM6/NTAB) family NADH-FMN oxidoreductase RutF